MGDLDNDMDELFRKAANQYPLKTDGADWDKVMGKLPEAVNTPLPIIEQKTGKTNKKLLWLILLFPMGWLCNSYFNNGNSLDKVDSKPITINSTKKIDKQLQLIDNQKNKNDIISKVDNSFNTNQTSAQAKSTINKLTFKNDLETYSNTKNSFYINTSREQLQNKANLQNGKIAGKNNLEDDKINASGTNIKNEVENGNQFPLTKNPALQTANKIDNNTDTTAKLVSNKKDSIQLPNTDTAKNVAKKANKKSIEKSRGFYISVIGGFDASSVKSQGVKKVGYGFGLLVGYQLNKHIAFETGLMWDKKKYYTDGEYFSKTRTDIPSNYYISDINGNCNMFEVPIDFRYNFAHSKKGLFFATAGLSSYFMKKEDYNYEATAWGATWPAMKTYNNSGSNLFSVVNLSVGLEHKISRSISVRINPYLKIPLKGLGIGSIPITSSGVNIGITIPFHK